MPELLDSSSEQYTLLESKGLVNDSVEPWIYSDRGEPFILLVGKRDSKGQLLPQVGDLRGAIIYNFETENPLILKGVSAPMYQEIEVSDESLTSLFEKYPPGDWFYTKCFEGVIISISLYNDKLVMSTNSSPDISNSRFLGSSTFKEMFISAIGKSEEELKESLFSSYRYGAFTYYFIVADPQLGRASHFSESKLIYIGCRKNIFIIDEEKYPFSLDECCFFEHSEKLESYKEEHLSLEEAAAHLKRGYSPIESEFSQEPIIIKSKANFEGVCYTPSIKSELYKIVPRAYSLRMDIVGDSISPALGVCSMWNLSHPINFDAFIEKHSFDGFGDPGVSVQLEDVERIHSIEEISSLRVSEGWVNPALLTGVEELIHRLNRFYYMCLILKLCSHPANRPKIVEECVSFISQIGSVADFLTDKFKDISIQVKVACPKNTSVEEGVEIVKMKTCKKFKFLETCLGTRLNKYIQVNKKRLSHLLRKGGMESLLSALNKIIVDFIFGEYQRVGGPQTQIPGTSIYRILKFSRMMDYS